MTEVMQATTEPVCLDATGKALNAGEEISALIFTCTANGSFILNDNTTGTGRNRIRANVLANSSFGMSFPKPVHFPNGAYATIAGAGGYLTLIK